ncbi:MAG TPA: SIMPL domain-containing protein [Actinomycetota bacterium]
MTRRMGVIVIAAVVAGLVIWFAATAMAQSGATPSAKPARTITVSSTATVNAQPDEVVLDLGVRFESADSAAAFAQNAKDMQAVLDALKAAGITDKDVQTTNVSLEQNNQGKPNERRVFVASNSVQVTIHDMSSVGSVIDAAVNAGADSVNDISFQLSNPNTIRTDALSQAVTGARTKAEALARAAGAEVMRVVTIDEQNFRPPVYNQSLAALPRAGVPTPVVPPSSLQVSVTIAVVWEIA